MENEAREILRQAVEDRQKSLNLAKSTRARIALFGGAAVATRDIADVAGCAVEVIDP